MGDPKKMLQVRSARQVPVRVMLLDDEIYSDSVDVRMFIFQTGFQTDFFEHGSEVFTPGLDVKQEF